MFRIIIFSLAILALNPSIHVHAACGPQDYARAQSETRRLQNLIEELVAKRDVDLLVQAYRQELEKCDLPVDHFGVSPRQLDAWRNKGFESEVIFLKNKIEVNSYYENVDEWIEKYKKMKWRAARKVDVNDEKMFRDAQVRSRGSDERLKTTCKPMDLREKFGPVRDQDSGGSCYAFAAADLLSYYTKYEVSATDIAIQNNAGINYIEKAFYDLYKNSLGMVEKDFTGGKVSKAINHSLAKGLCLEKSFPSEDNTGAQIMDVLVSYERQYRNKRDNVLQCVKSNAASSSAELDKIYSQVKEILPNSQYTVALADANCKPRLRPRLKAVDHKMDGFNHDNLWKNLNEQLDKNEPVGISYHTSIIRHESDGLKGRHAGTVVARRMNPQTKSCEFLIRNLWGKGCAYTERDCEDGHIWVPAKDIYRGVYSLTLIEKEQ